MTLSLAWPSKQFQVVSKPDKQGHHFCLPRTKSIANTSVEGSINVSSLVIFMGHTKLGQPVTVGIQYVVV